MCTLGKQCRVIQLDSFPWFYVYFHHLCICVLCIVGDVLAPINLFIGSNTSFLIIIMLLFEIKYMHTYCRGIESYPQWGGAGLSVLVCAQNP